jgi:LacI family transcriptional regulator
MATIFDVARRANVSVATVSRVINHPGKVTERTRRKVSTAMEACGYVYNALAMGLSTKRSRTIGIVIPNITNPIFSESTRGIQDYASEKGYHVILVNTDYLYEKEKKLVSLLREKQVEGLVLTTNKPEGEIVHGLIKDGFPFVLTYSHSKHPMAAFVGVNNIQGGMRATEFLIGLKHRRVGMIALDFSLSDRSYQRWLGYRRSLKKNGLPYDPDLVVQTEYTFEKGKKAVESLMTLPYPPTAVFCTNDILALGAMKGLKEIGKKIPEEVSIAGFDDIAFSKFVAPPLTSIHQPAYTMGWKATEILFELLSKFPFQASRHRILLETELVVRQSCAPLLKKKVKR